MHIIRGTKACPLIGITALLAGLLLGIAPAQSTVGQVRAEGDYALDSDASPAGSGSRNAPTLAANPGDHNHVVEAHQDSVTHECEHHVSLDGGATWTGGDLTAPAGFPASPCAHDPARPSLGAQSLMFGSGDQVYVVWLASTNPADSSAGHSVLMSTSSDGGQSFDEADVALAGAGAPGSDYATPELVVDPRTASADDDRIYVATRDLRTGRAFIVRSDDSGLTWNPRVQTTDTDAAAPVWNADHTAVTTPGDAFVRAIELTQPVLGQAPAEGGPRPLYLGWVARKNDGACPPACETADENAASGYLVVAKSWDLGQTWTRTRAVNVRGPMPPNGVPTPGTNAPRLASRFGNDVFMVFNQQPGLGGSNNCGPGPYPSDDTTTCRAYPGFSQADHAVNWDRHVYFIRSFDGGATWKGLQKINPRKRPGLVADEIVQTARPQVYVAADGRVDVVWNDLRHTFVNTTNRAAAVSSSPIPGMGGLTWSCATVRRSCPEARLGDTYYVRSRDRGRTFTANRRLSERSSNIDLGPGSDRFSDYRTSGPVVVHSGTDALLLADLDTRLGNAVTNNQDIFLRTVDLNASAPMPTENAGTGSAPALSVALSQRVFPGGGEAVSGEGETSRAWTRPVIVNEADMPSALAGGVLARGNLGPLLASPQAGLPATVQTEVDRLDPVGIYIIGDATRLSATVEAQVVAAGVPAGQVVRIQGGTPAEIAANIAMNLDRRFAHHKLTTPPLPAFDAVVIANPNSASAASAAALAANRRLPLLYVDQNAVPAATTSAISQLGVTQKILVGSTSVISAGVATTLGSGVTRIGDGNQFLTSDAVLAESVSRGLPTNVVYVADGNEPMHGALLGAAIARLGGLLTLAPGGSAAAAESTINALGLCSVVDRIVTSDLTGTATVANDPPGTGPGAGPGPCPTPPQEPAPELPDLAAPETTITSGPADDGWLLGTSTTVGYESSETGSAFQCELDGAPRDCGVASTALSGLSQATHEFAVVAIDSAGNADPTPATRTFTVPRNNTVLKHSSGWASRKGSGYFLDSYSQASAKGRTLSTQVSDVSALALVATKGKGHGIVKVFLGRKLLRKVQLTASSLKKQQVIPVATFGSGRSGTVKIKVATGGKIVRIEGLGVATS